MTNIGPCWWNYLIIISINLSWLFNANKWLSRWLWKHFSDSLFYFLVLMFSTRREPKINQSQAISFNNKDKVSKETPFVGIKNWFPIESKRNTMNSTQFSDFLLPFRYHWLWQGHNCLLSIKWVESLSQTIHPTSLFTKAKGSCLCLSFCSTFIETYQTIGTEKVSSSSLTVFNTKTSWCLCFNWWIKFDIKSCWYHLINTK